MQIIDMHSHWGTKRGYALQDPAELAMQEHNWKHAPSYVSEAEMADHFRQLGVRTILDFGFTRYLPIAEVRELHDYAIGFAREHSDVVLGIWVTLDPRLGQAALDEIKRCRNAGLGVVGFVAAAAPLGFAPSDPVFFPFYELCSEAGMPALITVGYSGLGAGLPGGKGLRLEHGHPLHVDEVAARYPRLKVLAGRRAWPWQSEMIAVLRHKGNVWCELHGWLPRHFSDELKHEIGRTLQDRVMFGGDYPLFRYSKLIQDWNALGYEPAVLEKVFYKNAMRFLGLKG